MKPEWISSFFNDKRGVDFRFTIEEFSGAFGDSITVIPLLVGIALTTNATLSHLLLFFGMFQIVVGLYFRLPMPVEPMKALAALGIAGTLSYSEITTAGVVLGVLLLLSGFMGLMNKLDRLVPVSVVRGIQLGLALILLKSAIGYISNSIWLAAIGIAVVLFFLLLNMKKNVSNISAFIVILIGIIYGIYVNGPPPISLIDPPGLSLPQISSLPKAITIGAFPQFMLSVGNAVLATSLLFRDLLNQRVSPDNISKSMGAMCLTSSLFGGFPMCHGSGGLAGQYRFGARTGGSNIILGSVYLGAAMIAGSASFLGFFPYSILGALLVFISLELGSAAKETDKWEITLITGIISLLTNIGIGFIAGLLTSEILKRSSLKE
ncbi:MAG: putative sulfate/molybdate transporter [Candidatus Hadarchaeota archaeon]